MKIVIVFFLVSLTACSGINKENGIGETKDRLLLKEVGDKVIFRVYTCFLDKNLDCAPESIRYDEGFADSVESILTNSNLDGQFRIIKPISGYIYNKGASAEDVLSLTYGEQPQGVIDVIYKMRLCYHGCGGGLYWGAISALTFGMIPHWSNQDYVFEVSSEKEKKENYGQDRIVYSIWSRFSSHSFSYSEEFSMKNRARYLSLKNTLREFLSSNEY